MINTCFQFCYCTYAGCRASSKSITKKSAFETLHDSGTQAEARVTEGPLGPGPAHRESTA